MKIFVSYSRRDAGDFANQIQKHLSTFNFDIFTDVDSIKAGEIWSNTIEDNISNCDIFVVIVTDGSLQSPHVEREVLQAQKEKKTIIPCFYRGVKRKEINWNLQKIQGVEFEEKYELVRNFYSKINSQIDISNDDSTESILKLPSKTEEVTIQFEGEKKVFVGRGYLINKIIKEKLQAKGSIVSIIGLGGSGKTQLSYKAIHQYLEEKIFDVVIPIYFSRGIPSFSSFLSRIAESLGLPLIAFEKESNLEQRKKKLKTVLESKKHPLIYLDNFETISYTINNLGRKDIEDHSQQNDFINNHFKELNNNNERTAIDIHNFLNHELPNNVSILLTSRERINNFDNENIIELEGLEDDKSFELFTKLANDSFLKNPDGKFKEKVIELLKRIGGHPLSIEIIAKNISINEVDNILMTLGIDKINKTEKEQRLQSLKLSFDYTVNKLDTTLQSLLWKLTSFKSPFPIDAPIEIFGNNYNKMDVEELYNRGIITRIESDSTYGKIKDPSFLLYSFHPAIRIYVEDKKRTLIKCNSHHSFIQDTNKDFEEKFSLFYYKFLFDTCNSIGKENHSDALARCSLIYQNKDNDFEQAIIFSKDQNIAASILSYIGYFLYNMGLAVKSIDCYERSLKIHSILNDEFGMADDYTNIGKALKVLGSLEEAHKYMMKANKILKEIDKRSIKLATNYRTIGIVLKDMERFKDALKYHKNALKIDKKSNNEEGKAKDYRSMGIVFLKMHNLTEALDYIEKALAIDKKLDDRIEMSKDYNTRGQIFYEMMDYENSLKSYEESLKIDTELKRKLGIAKNFSYMGIAYYKMNNLKQALDCINKALEIHDEYNDEIGMSKNYYYISLVYEKIDKNNKNDKINVLHYLLNSKQILKEFEKETGYIHPFTNTVLSKIRELELQ